MLPTVDRTGDHAIVPPARLGMLGGGQLGRYSLIAARVMGFGTLVLDPDPAAPAGRIADTHLVAAYDDPAALDALAATCARRHHRVRESAGGRAGAVGRHVVVRAASRSAVAVAQDRLPRSASSRDHRFPWHRSSRSRPPTTSPPCEDATWPVIVKTARLGYDGKGQVSISEAGGRRGGGLDGRGRCPAVVEQRVPLDVELSVIVARTATGETVVYPVAENHHVGGVLDVSVVPARVDPTVASAATELAVAVAGALGYVGVLAVELFVSDGALLVNELAPRPHNSGHWTLDAAPTSQFEQQVRAVCGLTLGATDLAADAVAMVNLLGDRWAGGEPDWSVALGDPGAHLHLYGKSEPGRAARWVTSPWSPPPPTRPSTGPSVCARSPHEPDLSPERADLPSPPRGGRPNAGSARCRRGVGSSPANWRASVAPMTGCYRAFSTSTTRNFPKTTSNTGRCEDIYAAAVAHLELGRVRAPDEPIVRVLSPERERDGWRSDHSVVLVVTDDMPFVVDTLRLVLERHDLGIHLLVHPMLAVERDHDHRIVGLAEAPGAALEAWTQIEIERIDDATGARLTAELNDAVADVRRVVGDFDAMRNRMLAMATADPLLAWLADGNFIFLGSAEYDRADDGAVSVQPGSMLGMSTVSARAARPRSMNGPGPIVIARTDDTSRVLQSAAPDGRLCSPRRPRRHHRDSVRRAAGVECHPYQRARHPAHRACAHRTVGADGGPTPQPRRS